jgi:hypothetical protein
VRECVINFNLADGTFCTYSLLVLAEMRVVEIAREDAVEDESDLGSSDDSVVWTAFRVGCKLQLARTRSNREARDAVAIIRRLHAWADHVFAFGRRPLVKLRIDGLPA